LGGLMITRRGPSLTRASTIEEGLEALQDDAPQTDDLRNRALRHRLSRRLLDDPVVYYARLPADELAYLTSQRPHLLRRLQEATGLVPEVRQEGIALLDPTGQASDLRMPEEGTDGHATLLVAEYLAETLRMGPTGAIPWETLERLLERAAEAHKSYWRREAREPGAARPLARFAVRRLEALGLVRLEAEGVRPEPAIARFAYREPMLHTSGAAGP
ncbi:MAG: TIGR02678 family protein, partial [Candidatus Dormibacteraceae bacterium]